jgi:hypothetical protein
MVFRQRDPGLPEAIAGRQLALFSLIEEPKTWVTGWRPRTCGPAQYTIMIRSPEDPERSPRPPGGRPDRAPHRALEKTTPSRWTTPVLSTLQDHGPSTFNALSVILLDKTADITGGTPLEEALWQLACDRRIAFTLEAPVLFKIHTEE